MAAGRAHKAARRVRLQPTLILSPVPDSVFGPKHPAAPFAVEHREVSDRQPECTREQVASSAFFRQVLVADFSFSERIDSHAESIARKRVVESEGV